MEGVDLVGVEPALHACASCKKNKRRCDKTLPSCSLCLKVGRRCTYSGSSPESHDDEIGNLRSRVQELEEHVQGLSAQATHASHRYLPSPPTRPQLHVQASFLDSDVWSSCNLSVQISNDLVPDEIAAVLGGQSDIDTIKARYFQSAHTWMPIISKIRLDRLTHRSYDVMRADMALLFLCMKLMQEVPGEQQPVPSELYVTTKRFLDSLQMKGLLTVRIVQAGLLLSVYELGHAIFPAAFMTIGLCARIGIVLGLHSKLAPQLAGKPRSWTDWEERQRVWWMTVILDRYVSIGADYRPLYTEDPSKDTLLPADDSAWDTGEMVPPERVSLSSQQTPVGPFARLAQAANLLGRVIRHCNETSLELDFVLDNFEALDQTILSLMALLSTEHSTPSTETCTATALCFRQSHSLEIPFYSC
ncbi:hypothetical protein FSARC_7030 [Fusarium sarcochroum]|uniref:Zn(2)-C6 fungal-type domain-containing protein n=1 Tax=Fusarium sarcochroum TaxID=1208366 RepID=A0A8H4X7U2_9HYPO|nr:hypothetical protein FSARC_7030 [Fusarium sarcochroum]